MMKKFIVLVLLMGYWDFSFAFENEKLNALYEKLQAQVVANRQAKNTLANVVYLVGDDGACQYTLIRDAIMAANNNSSNSYEIRVAYNKTYTENLLITGPDQTLKGGYSDCSKANIDELGTSNTELDATAASLPAIIIRNSSGSVHNINVLNFNISGGTGTASNPSGGISIRDNDLEVHIENSVINGNTGVKGGGLYVEGVATDVYIKDSYLIVNDAANGGGLYCDAADVFVYGDSGISVNNAIGTSFDGSGGGVYLTNSCHFNLFSGTSGGFLDFRGIAGNIANRDGGGIYAEDGTQVLLMGYLFFGDFGNNDQPVNITANKANNSNTTRLGGGIYAADATTSITAYASIINNNETLAGSTSTAAGMYLYQADFSIGKLDSVCWNQQKCNQISGNIVSGANASNAGITALSGATVNIKNTWISDHSSSANVFLYGQSINAVIEGNVFTGNGGASVDGNTSLLSFHSSAANGLSVAYNTFVNNEINTSLLRINNTPSLLMHGNIIKESNNVNILGVAGGSSSSAQFNCMIVHEDSSFSGSSIFVNDPQFIDEANEDFHISATSPAIDLCGNDYVATTKDLDDENRAWDDLITDNIDGAFDAGVDEFYPATTADLSVSKILQTSAPYYVGETVNYQITVTNNGPDTATNVHVQDNPSGMLITNVQSTNCSSFPCIIPSINNGSSQVISVTATLRSTEGLFDNSVTVYSQDYDPNSNDNTDDTGNSGTAVVDNVDMVVGFSLSTSGPYHSGQVVTYQTSITNSGPETARNVVISNNNLLNTQLLNTVGAPCVQLPCNIVAFASGATVNLTLSVKIVTGGSFSFGINVTTDSTDDNLSDNSGVVLNQIAQNTGDLEISAQLITPATYVQGQSVELTLTVANNGPDTIGSIEVSSILTNLNVTSVSGAGCTSLPCGGLVLVSGDDLTISVVATIINSGEFGLDASVNSSNSYDSYANNNDDSVLASTLPTGDLEIVAQLITTPTYVQGQTVEITLVITNNGPDAVDLIEVSSSLTHLTINSINGVGCTSLPCSNLSLASGADLSLTVMATINASGDFGLTVTVASATSYDPDSNNNSHVVNDSALDANDIIFENSFE